MNHAIFEHIPEAAQIESRYMNHYHNQISVTIRVCGKNGEEYMSLHLFGTPAQHQEIVSKMQASLNAATAELAENTLATSHVDKR